MNNQTISSTVWLVKRTHTEIADGQYKPVSLTTTVAVLCDCPVRAIELAKNGRSNVTVSSVIRTDYYEVIIDRENSQ